MSEQNLQQLTRAWDALDLPIAYWLKGRGWIYANPSFLHLWSISGLEDFPEDHWNRLFQVTEWGDQWNTLLADRELQSDFCHLKLSDDQMTWGKIHCRPLPLGSTLGAVLSIEDGSEIQKLRFQNKDLKEQNEFLREFERMANASKDAISLINRYYIYCEANKTYLSRRQFKREEVVGKSVPSLWDPAVFETHIRPAIDKALTGHEVSYQAWINFSGREDRFTNVTYTPYRNSKGVYSHVLVTSQDMTDSKLAEMEMLKSLREAEESSEAKSLFLANICSRFTTPMNRLLSLGENGGCDSPQEIAALSHHLKDMQKDVHALIDFARHNGRDPEPVHIPFDLYGLIEQVLHTYRYTTDQNRVALQSLIDSKTPQFIVGDPTKLKRILTQYLKNALKYTEEGEVVLHVSTLSKTETQAEIRFLVKDTGRGIPQNLHDHIFEPFPFANLGFEDELDHVGLGLALVRQVAEGIGANVGFSSEENVGSEFWVTCTFDRRPHHSERRVKNIKNSNVFFLGQSKDQAERLREFIRSWGCRVDIGSEIPKDLPEPFDFVIVCDENLKVSPEETLRQLRLSPNFTNTKFLLITTPGRKGDARRMQEAGFSAYLTLPFTPEQVYHCLCLMANSEQVSLITRFDADEIQNEKRRILVVDDVVTNLKVVSKILTRAGFYVDVAQSGEEAIIAVQSKDYHCILMDVHMPDMDGQTCTQNIRLLGYDEETLPIIALTADILPETRSNCFESGMNDHQHKPFKKVDLISIIEKWVY